MSAIPLDQDSLSALASTYHDEEAISGDSDRVVQISIGNDTHGYTSDLEFFTRTTSTTASDTVQSISNDLDPVAAHMRVRRQAHLELGRELRYLKLLTTSMEATLQQSVTLDVGAPDLPLLEDPCAAIPETCLAQVEGSRDKLRQAKRRSHLEFLRELRYLRSLVAGMEELWRAASIPW
mmetsp:Transcript_108677/g.325060  ORF Transcript_108677/g.325060 Transcript_108677/m.325060 type:complete len:179 (-) Transcript_108677:29-565(-)